jgi:hypothetical protein
MFSFTPLISGNLKYKTKGIYGAGYRQLWGKVNGPDMYKGILNSNVDHGNGIVAEIYSIKTSVCP